MQDIKEEYQRLIKSKKFKNEGILSGAFLMSENPELDDTIWQLDFYNGKTDKMTSYKMNSEIVLEENSEVFKKEKSEVEELKLEEIKISLNKALDTGKILLGDNFKWIRIIIILQQIKQPIWNLSYMTQKFDLRNIKINAVNGGVLDNQEVKLFSFEKGNLK
ncbi:hypothetical protein J4440_04185 [Candidatus Woesearchaeota archaeon]|nr:hypothetical protein [Candidatus Woesearchaeota archaeon]